MTIVFKSAGRKSLMRSSTALVVISSLLVNCGGETASSGAAAPAADTLSPVVTLTASQLTPQGGETVILSAEVSDNRDADLAATVGCDAGNLRGDFLIIPQTDVDLTIACTATARDAAGNEGMSDLTISVAPTVTSLELAEGKESVAQGEVIVVFTDNLAPLLPSYEAKLSDVDVTLYATFDGGLGLIVPLDMPPGEHLLSLEVDGTLFSFIVSVEATPDVLDPDQVIEDSLTRSIEAIELILITTSLPLNLAEQGIFEDQREALQDVLRRLSSFTEEERQTAAKYLLANEESISAAALSTQQALMPLSESCLTEAVNFARESVLTAAAIGGVSVGTIALATIPIFGVIAGVSFGVVGYVKVLERVYSPTGVIARAGDTFVCIAANAVVTYRYGRQALTGSSAVAQRPNATIVKAAAEAENSFTFLNGRLADFSVMEVNSLTGEASDIFFETIAEIQAAFGALDLVPESLSSTFSSYEQETAETVETGVTLSALSNNDITGTLTYVAGQGRIEFDYTGLERDQLDEGVDFTFDLTREDQLLTTVDATLTALPQASDAMVTVVAAAPSQFDVNAFGSDVLILTQPTKGRVEVIDSDTFIYTADGGAMGEDSFGFAALLGAQQSEEATLFINIVADVPTVANLSFEYDVEDNPSGEASFDLTIEAADRIRITRAPTKGTVLDALPSGRFTYRPNEGAEGVDSFDYVAENAAGMSMAATVTLNIMPLPVDCSVFTDLVAGSCTMFTATSPDVIYDLELTPDPGGSASGRSVYTLRDNGVEYNMVWSIREVGPGASNLGVSSGCVLYDSGFFNAGFDNLLRSNLTNPVTSHRKYELGGVFGFPVAGNYFGLDLSTQTPAVTFTKQ